MEAERPVRQAADHQELTEVAEVLVAGGAPPAFATRREERADDVVARSDVVDAVTDLLDDAGAFVPADERVVAGQVAGARVVIRMAQARGRELDEHLARLGLVEVELDHVPGLAGFPHDCCARLHFALPTPEPRSG